MVLFHLYWEAPCNLIDLSSRCGIAYQASILMKWNTDIAKYITGGKRSYLGSGDECLITYSNGAIYKVYIDLII